MGRLTRSSSPSLSPLLLLCLIALFSLHPFRKPFLHGCNAKELEGFGEEFDDDEFETEETVADIPFRSTFHSDARQETEDATPAEAKGGRDIKGEVVQEGESGRDDKVGEGSRKKSDSVWDDDEFEGLPEEGEGEGDAKEADEAMAAAKKKERASSFMNRPSQSGKKASRKGPLSYIVEVLAGTVLVLYAINYWFGRKDNEKLALAWAEQYCSDNGIFDKNFSLLGSGDTDDEPLLMKEGQNVFKFYASGRRFCEGLLATLDLQSRHDLISVALQYLTPKKDLLTIHVYMNEDSMDPFVLAVTKRKYVKAMQRENKDLKEFGSLVDISPVRRRWPGEDLAVITDSRDAAIEILSDVVVDQVFGEKVFEKISDYFVSVHCSDQYPRGTHRRLISFSFHLPSAKKMGDLSRLMAAVPVFIDNVARFKLSASARSKAESVRAKHLEEEEKEKLEVRLEAIQRKKEEKRREEERRRAEIEARLPPEELAKRIERERAKQARKNAPKVKLTRIH